MNSAGLTGAISGRSTVVRFAASTGSVLAAVSLLSGAMLTDARLIGPELSGTNGFLSWLMPLHRDASFGVGALVVLTAIVAFRRRQRVQGMLAGLACVAGLADGFGTPSMRVMSLHAIAGVSVFACMTAVAVLSWCSDAALPRMLVPSSFPVRTTAAWIPWIVLSQVTMGSLYRHNIWSVMPHMGGAMVVAFLIIADAVLILQASPLNPLLVRCARWALSAVLIQVLLGITDFLLRLLDFQNSTVWRVTSIAHVLVGGVTFAVSILLAVVVRAYVPKHQEEGLAAGLGRQAEAKTDS